MESIPLLYFFGDLNISFEVIFKTYIQNFLDIHTPPPFILLFNVLFSVMSYHDSTPSDTSIFLTPHSFKQPFIFYGPKWRMAMMAI